MKNLGIFLWILAAILWSLLLAAFIRYEANRAVEKISSILEKYDQVIIEH